MALMTCPECGQQISDRAPACIYCGYPLTETVNTSTYNLDECIASFDALMDKMHYESKNARIKNKDYRHFPGLRDQKELDYGEHAYYADEAVTLINQEISCKALWFANHSRDDYVAYMMHILQRAVFIQQFYCYDQDAAYYAIVSSIDFSAFSQDELKSCYTMAIKHIENGPKDYGGYISSSTYPYEWLRSSRLQSMAFIIDLIRQYSDDELKKRITQDMLRLDTERKYQSYISQPAQTYQYKVVEQGVTIGVEPTVQTSIEPRCPTCSSTNITRITTGQKAISVLAFGLLSQKVKHQFKCNNCGYEW